jgi:uncharacterized protein YndB with AHSA1/START domain
MADHIAQVTIEIDAPPSAVWRALTDPGQVKQWMHGTNLSTTWEVGSPVTWSGEWKGEAYEDKGEVLEVEPERRLGMTHWSPLGGSEDLPENYHRLVYELSPAGDGTTLTLKQGNNPSQEAADEMAKKNWKPVIEQLKAVAEGRAVGSATAP